MAEKLWWSGDVIIEALAHTPSGPNMIGFSFAKKVYRKTKKRKEGKNEKAKPSDTQSELK